MLLLLPPTPSPQARPNPHAGVQASSRPPFSKPEPHLASRRRPTPSKVLPSHLKEPFVRYPYVQPVTVQSETPTDHSAHRSPPSPPFVVRTSSRLLLLLSSRTWLLSRRVWRSGSLGESTEDYGRYRELEERTGEETRARSAKMMTQVYMDGSVPQDSSI